MSADFNKRHKRCSGFSALEMLIVVAIFLILGAVALPRLTTWRSDSNLMGAIRQVQSDLNWARMEAVQRSAPVTVTFTSGQAAYTIWTDRNRNGASDTGETVSHSVQDSFQNVSVASNATMVFQPRGTATTTGTVSITNSQKTRSLSVNAAGKVMIQ